MKTNCKNFYLSIKVTTPEGVPGPVADIKAVPMGKKGALLIVWDKPVEINGILTGYQVFKEEVRGTSVVDRTEWTPRPNESQTRIKWGKLKPGTMYRITVKATTSAGEGAENFVEARTRGNEESDTKPGVPKFHLSKLPYDQSDQGMVGVRITWLPNIESGR